MGKRIRKIWEKGVGVFVRVRGMGERIFRGGVLGTRRGRVGILVGGAGAVVMGVGMGMMMVGRGGEVVEVDPLAGLSEAEREEVTEVVMPAEVAEAVDEEYFHLSFNLEEGTVTTKAGEVGMAEFLGVSEGEVEGLVRDGLLEAFLRYNLIGEVTSEGGVVKVSNPYSTRTLAVKAEPGVAEGYAGVTGVKEVGGGYYLVEWGSAVETKAGYEAMRREGKVEGVVRDLEVEAGDLNLEGGERAVAAEFEAWGVATMGADHYTEKLILAGNEEEVRVAVLDTGINAAHEVFAESETGDRLDLTYAYNYVDNNADPTDDKGHGTEVAGVIVESTPGNVKVVPMKVMDATGHGSFSNIIAAAVDVDEYVEVINMSLGVVVDETNEDMMAAIEYFNGMLAEVEAVMVAASGNDGINASDFPARSPYVWSIGAVDAEGAVASFSNYDENIDFTAPGVSLKLPWYTGANVYAQGDSGTSFASPFVAAAVALVLAEHPGYAEAQVYEILKENVADLGEAGKDIYYGNGSVDFNAGMFSRPDFAVVETERSWSKEANNTVVGAVSSGAITHAAVTEDVNEPAEWLELQNSYDYVYFDFDLGENGTYYIWLKDANGKMSYTEVTVDHVDYTAPEVAEDLAAAALTQNKATVAVKLKEEGSGLAQIDWKIRAEGAEEVKTETESLGDEESGVAGAEMTRTHTFMGLMAKTKYEVTATVQDLAGNATEVPALVVTTNEAGVMTGDDGATVFTAEVEVVMGMTVLSTDLETEVSGVSMELTPGGGLATAGMVVRTSGNTKLKLSMSMEGDETALVRAGGGRIEGTEEDGVSGAGMEENHWGYSTNGSTFDMVPGVGEPAVIGRLAYDEGTQDTAVTFGAKAGASLGSGEYGGRVVLVLAVDG